MSSSDEPSVLVYQFIAAETSGDSTLEFSGRLATLMNQRSLSLLKFIQTLGPTLTSEDVSPRVISLSCFAETLAQVESSIVSKQDVGVLLQFLSQKLEDEKLTAHTLNALTSLVKAKNFIAHMNDNLQTLLQTLIKSYDPRKHLARVRYEAFLLLEAIMVRHAVSLTTTLLYSETFVNAFIHIATGEKDPRNLLVSFKLNALISEKIHFEDRNSNKTHDELLSDLFDVCFCYFPISFSTPENDPYKITAADLKVELRKTVASQSQFSQDVFPSLFEKLTSTNPTVRNDVLECLLLCSQNYAVEQLEQYWLPIWDALRYEILHNDILTFSPEANYIIPPGYETLDESDDNKTLILTLLVLNKLAHRLSGSESFPSIVATILEGLETNYKSLVGKTSKPAVLLLCALGYSSPSLFNEAVDKLFSFEVWGHYIRSDYTKEATSEPEEVDVLLTIAKQRDLIDNLGYVITAQRLLGQSCSLDKYKDHMLIFMGQLLQTSSSIEKSLKCKIVLQLTKLIMLESFLSREEVTLVLTWFSENLNALIESDHSNIESDVLLKRLTQSLTSIMSESKEEILQSYISSVISIVLSSLLDKVSNPAVLNVINQICLNYQFLEVLSIRYLNKLAYESPDDDLCISLIESLIFSFKQAQEARPFLATSWYTKFIPRFLDVVSIHHPENAVIMQISGRLVGLIIRFCDKSKHNQILADMIALFFRQMSLEGVSIQFNINEPSMKISLLKHIIANIDRGCQPAVDSVQNMISQVIEEIPNIGDDLLRMEYLQLLSLLVNKFTTSNDEKTQRTVEQLFIEGKSKDKTFEVCIWIVKGLLVKVDKKGLEFLNYLLSELVESDDLKYCQLISRSFAVLMSDLEIFSNTGKSKIISSVVNLNVKVLYKQQVFERTSPILIKQYLESEVDAKKQIYLSTLSILIQNVSAKVINPHLKEVLPLVLNGLYSNSSSILKASLQTLDIAILESSELIQNDLQGLITKLLTLGTKNIVFNKKRINTEDIRLLSLDCLLKIFKELDVAKTSSYHQGLIQSLAPGLDDKRRSVRKKTTDLCQVLHELGR